jgi:hydrogenase expression/formation protein HypC
MKIIKKQGLCATAEVDGVKREINLRLLDDAQIGDYVLVHAGFAIEKVDEHEAEETLKMMKEIVNWNTEDEVR